MEETFELLDDSCFCVLALKMMNTLLFHRGGGGSVPCDTGRLTVRCMGSCKDIESDMKGDWCDEMSC